MWGQSYASTQGVHSRIEEPDYQLRGHLLSRVDFEVGGAPLWAA